MSRFHLNRSPWCCGDRADWCVSRKLRALRPEVRFTTGDKILRDSQKVSCILSEEVDDKIHSFEHKPRDFNGIEIFRFVLK